MHYLTDANSNYDSRTNLTSSYALYESIKPKESHYEMETSVVRTSGRVYCRFYVLLYTTGWSVSE